MSVTIFSFVGFVQVMPDGKSIKTLSGKWLTNLPPFEPADHIADERMINAIFRENAVVGGSNIYPAPGFYNVNARGYFEFGCNDDGGTLSPVFEYSGHQPASEHSINAWFLDPQPIRPVFFNLTLPHESKEKENG